MEITHDYSSVISVAGTVAYNICNCKLPVLLSKEKSLPLSGSTISLQMATTVAFKLRDRGAQKPT